MDAKLVRQWKAGFEEVNRFTLEEARARTPAERLALLQSHLRQLGELGLLRTKGEDLEFHIRWQSVRERFLSKNPAA